VRPLLFCPRVELLEARAVPTVFTVNTAAMTLAPDGQVSLWEAIAAANTNAPFGDAPAGYPGLDTIRFAHSLNGQTIVYPASVNTEGLSAVEDLTIVGPGAGLLTISGNNTARIFNVNPFSQTGVDVVISGLTLARKASAWCFHPATFTWGSRTSLRDRTSASLDFVPCRSAGMAECPIARSSAAAASRIANRGLPSRFTNSAALSNSCVPSSPGFGSATAARTVTRTTVTRRNRISISGTLCSVAIQRRASQCRRTMLLHKLAS
jgi:hypothetical protein